VKSLIFPASVLVTASCALGLFLAGDASLGSEPIPQSDSVTVRLRSRSVNLSSGSTSEFRDSLFRALGNGLHGLVALRRLPRAADIRALSSRGITLISRSVGPTYRAKVLKSASFDSATSRILLGVALLRPEDRVLPDVWLRNYGRFAIRSAAGDSVNYVVGSDSLLRLVATFYSDTPDSAVSAALAGAVERRRLGRHAWHVTLSRASLIALAERDPVRWITTQSPPTRVDNDLTRGLTNVDWVQDFSTVIGLPAGLGGRDVQVGVFDQGIDDDHDDFKGFLWVYFLGPKRVIVTDPAMSWHGTMVAGIIAGDGRASAQTDNQGTTNGTVPYKWRGMAPRAELLEFYLTSISNGITGIDPLLNAQKIHDFTVNHKMDLSNHSYNLDSDREYGLLSAQSDSMLAGDGFADLLHIPPRMQVYSAGNNGGVDGNSLLPFAAANVENSGYFSLNKQLKNALVVGNWNGVHSRIATSSSLGPSEDGRIKPDVVAPGSSIKAPAYWKSGLGLTQGRCAAPDAEGSPEHRNFYGVDCGTSLSAPVVSGIAALMLDQYRTTTGLNVDVNPPLPSTLRAIAIHGAWDATGSYGFPNRDVGMVKAYPGPDFTTGWGLINAAQSVGIIERSEFLEGTIESTCSQQTYEFDVFVGPGGAIPNVRVTLAWDDPGADPSDPSGERRLVNDLDLVLEAPSGTRVYPWKRNQIVKDAVTLSPLAPESQTCGTAIIVDRMLTPPGPFTEAELDAASTGTGPDHLNNVEQVVVAGAAPGRWKAIVTGFDLARSQRFSLAGLGPRLQLLFDPATVCGRIPVFCRAVLYNLCDRYPTLCARPIVFPFGPRFARVKFRNMDDRAIMPVQQMCVMRGLTGGCRPGTSYEIRVESRGMPMTFELRDSNGQIIRPQPANAAGPLRFVFEPARLEYFLVGIPSGAAIPGRNYDVPLTIRPL
jgi:subtilisin family serine protease